MLKLQIVFPSGETVQFPAGGPIEANLVDIILAEIHTRPGVLKTKDTVRRNIADAIYKFKDNIRQVPVKLHE